MPTPRCMDSDGITESSDNLQPQIPCANDRRRERDRARRAMMANEKKMEINKKRREARKKKKGNSNPIIFR